MSEVTRPQSWAIMVCAAMLGPCSIHVPVAGVFAAGAIGALFAHHALLQCRVLLLVLLASLLLDPGGDGSLSFWLVVAQTTFCAFAPRRWVASLVGLPRWSWQIVMVLAAGTTCAMLLNSGGIAVPIALASFFFLGANIARHIAANDARLLVWGDEGLVAVTRDLLLGRVTSGMLHDLAQPLNVISMANGNMGYIVDHLSIEEEERRQLLERIERIAQHTQSAAAILSLFRWFGRDGSDDPAQLSVRSALERAVAATRSNVRHHDVAVELHGNGLDYLLPVRHGSLEMIAVAALLCAFGSFIGSDGSKQSGKVVLHASLSPAHVVISVQCTDGEGRTVPGRPMDHATSWLVSQVAQEASGDFRSLLRDATHERFIIRLGRDDI